MERLSSPGKSPSLPHVSRKASKRNCIWETSLHCATGYAKDYVECMWLILQNEKPEDFVIATGEQHSVREFCQLAFRHAGIELRFEGEGENEKGIDTKTGKVLVEVSPDLPSNRCSEFNGGIRAKAKRELGWNPQKTNFEQLVKIMVDADMAKVAVSVPENMYAPTWKNIWRKES